MKNSNPQKINWYIEPIGAFTNETIARRLAELNEIADSSNQLQLDNLGQEHSVYQLSSHKRVLEFYKSKSQFQLKFKIYTKTGPSAPIRESVIDSNEFKRAKKIRKFVEIPVVNKNTKN